VFFVRFIPHTESFNIMYMGCRLQSFKSIFMFYRLWRSKVNVIIRSVVVFAFCDNGYEPFGAVTRSMTY